MNDELYFTKAFLATSTDGECGFETFEVCGKIVEIESLGSLKKVLQITHYRKKRPPSQYLFELHNISNSAIDIVKFFANDDVVEY